MTDDMNVSNLPFMEIEVPIPEDALPKDPAEYLKDIPEYDDNFTIEMIIQKILKEEEEKMHLNG